MFKQIILFVLLNVLHLNNGYPHDAPKDICETLKSGHDEFAPQTTPFNYVVTTASPEIKPSQRMNMVIKGPKQFRGFIIVVKDGDQPVGRFDVPSNDPNAKTFNCSTNNANTASHKNIHLKDEVPLTWIAPAQFTNTKLEIYLTILEANDIFWENKLAGTLNTTN